MDKRYLNDKKENLKIISILGYDRSGTTFLGSYLKTLNPSIFFAGEIDKGLDHFFKGTIKNCTCGKPLNQCPVWGEILPDVDRDNPNIHRIFEKINDLTGAEIIVDSSKKLNFIKKIKDDFANEFYSIRVIRNPKAVIASRTKIRKSRVERGTHPKPHIASKYYMMSIYDSLEWSFYNLKLEKLKSKQGNIDLTYDLFSEDLDEKIKNFFIQNELNGNGIKQIENHIIWGNKGRLNFNPTIVINRSWSKNMKWFYKFSIDIITFPTRIIMGYKF
tara:strand:+ start:557 stop:1378 length:822 start_codon:yes stop_codon:yes gene_type:complete